MFANRSPVSVSSPLDALEFFNIRLPGDATLNTVPNEVEHSVSGTITWALIGKVFIHCRQSVSSANCARYHRQEQLLVENF